MNIYTQYKIYTSQNKRAIDISYMYLALILYIYIKILAFHAVHKLYRWDIVLVLSSHVVFWQWWGKFLTPVQILRFALTPTTYIFTLKETRKMRNTVIHSLHGNAFITSFREAFAFHPLYCHIKASTLSQILYIGLWTKLVSLWICVTRLRSHMVSLMSNTGSTHAAAFHSSKGHL